MRYIISISDRANKLVASMSFQELLDEAVCPCFSVDNPPERGYGSAFFCPAAKDRLQDRLAEFKKMCQSAPLITCDMESGPGEIAKGTTKFPSMMGCGVADSVELAYAMGRAAALEGADIGFNWTLAPCADIAHEIDSPVVSTRSAGRDLEQVIKITGAYIRGLQENGMMATAKHFPGDGFGTYDQHLTTPINPLNCTEWRKLSGKVFQSLIDQGVMAIMPGHIALPAFDQPDEELGLYPPATLSKRLMTDLLKDELGFDGIIVSDAISMGGAVGFKNYYDACALFWENGGDVLLFPRMDDAFYREMEQRLHSGLLTEATLRNRVARVLTVKERLGLFNKSQSNAFSLSPQDKQQNEEASQAIAKRCVRIIRDRKHVIPLKLTPETRILHLILRRDDDLKEGSLYRQFTGMIAHYSPKVTEMIDPGPDKLFNMIYDGEFDLVICSITAQQLWGTNVVRLYGKLARNMMGGWMKLATPVIFVAHHHSFVHLEYEAAMDTVINIYGSTPYSLERLLRGVTGEEPFEDS